MTIKILVIEDSETARRHLIEVLSADPELEVVGEAGDGRRGAELCQALRPDVVTVDMVLPVMTGVETVEYIMAYCPTPILVVSSSFNRGELFQTYQALAAGALDVLEKPRGDEPPGAWERTLIATIKLIARIKVITHLRGRQATGPGRASAPWPPARPRPTVPRAVAIGASSGGPGALLEVFRALPADFRVPILLVIHISPSFATALAEWLDQNGAVRVRPARDGEALAELGAGQVVMAPVDRHLVVREGCLRLTDEPERHSCRPSVDVLFESLAVELGPACVAALLTGMGKDGARGLRAIRVAGGLTIAQDEATSMVYGMPREAVLLDGVDRVLPLAEIAPALVAVAHARGGRG